jgi:AcrR family transcriptional regulator
MSLRQEKKQKAREDILGAARQLFDASGFDDSRMRDIAAAANVSYQTLYNYFPTKTQILQGILQEDVGHIASQLNEHTRSYRGDLLGTLRAFSQMTLAEIGGDNRELWRRATVDLLGASEEVLGLFTLIKTDSHSGLRLLLQRAKEFGELEPETQTELLADIVFSLTDYMFLRYLIDPSVTEAGMLRELDAQMKLLLTPYLRVVS